MKIAIIMILLLFGCTYPPENVNEDIIQPDINNTSAVNEVESKPLTRDILQDIFSGMDPQPPQVESCNLQPKEREFNQAVYYEGPLIDAHVHMPVASQLTSTIAIQSGFQDMPSIADVLIHDIVCVFESEGIKTAFGFYLMPNLDLGNAIWSVSDTEKKYPGKITPFFMPPPIHSLNPDATALEQTIKDNGSLFRGYGEVAFYQGTFSNANPKDPEFMSAYEIITQESLIVMMHPRVEHRGEVEHILKKYPNTNFLFHGGELDSWLPEIITSHQNAYVSLDASITGLHGWAPEHDFRAIPKEEFLAYFRENFDSILEETTNKWNPIIEANPKQYTWATDRWYRWQFDYEVGGLLEEFARAWIATLDPGVQENFAYKNAEKILE